MHTQEYLEFAIEIAQENPGMGIIELKDYIEAAWDAALVVRYDVVGDDGEVRDFFYEYDGQSISDSNARRLLLNAGLELDEPYA